MGKQKELCVQLLDCLERNTLKYHNLAKLAKDKGVEEDVIAFLSQVIVLEDKTKVVQDILAMSEAKYTKTQRDYFNLFSQTQSLKLKASSQQVLGGLEAEDVQVLVDRINAEVELDGFVVNSRLEELRKELVKVVLRF